MQGWGKKEKVAGSARSAKRQHICVCVMCLFFGETADHLNVRALHQHDAADPRRQRFGGVPDCLLVGNSEANCVTQSLPKKVTLRPTPNENKRNAELQAQIVS